VALPQIYTEKSGPEKSERMNTQTEKVRRVEGGVSFAAAADGGKQEQQTRQIS